MKTGRGLLVVGVLTALLLSASAGFVASSAPDGLYRVAQDQGFDTRAVAPSGGLLSGYNVPGIGHAGLSRGIAGVIGVATVIMISVGAGRLLRGSRRGDRPSDDGARDPASRA
ncbi:MAG: PDGLE domain-containing protein [Dehalococcoidia bacterium]